MPELPEVETTQTSLTPLLGQTVRAIHVRNGQLRWPVPQDLHQLVGRQLTGLSRRSKYIIADFADLPMLWHLGMSGSFRLCRPEDELRKHDHLIMDFENQQLRYHDPRRFGCVLWLDDSTHQKLLAPLGPEPLTDAFDADYLQQRLQHKQAAIKVALMDNQVVVGVGNIYATESLFNTGIHPAQPANSLSRAQIEALVMEIKRILQQAITLGGSTLRDYTAANGENGYFQQTLLAYGRHGETCVNCDTPLDNLRLGQRASVFCPQCQPLQPIKH